LRLAVACDARCVRPTSASHHIHYEHPRLARFRDRRTVRERAAFHDASTRFSGRKDHATGRSLPRTAPVHRASDAPVAPLARPACLLAERRPSSRRRDRFGHTPRERGVAPTTRSTFRRWVTSSSCLSRIVSDLERLSSPFAGLATLPSRPGARRVFARATHRTTLSGAFGSWTFARPRHRKSSFGLGRGRLTSLWATRRLSTSATLTTREHTRRAFDHRPRKRPRSLSLFVRGYAYRRTS